MDQLRDALRASRDSSRPTAVYVAADPAGTRLPPEAWWESPATEVADRDSTQLARKNCADNKSGQRRHL